MPVMGVGKMRMLMRHRLMPMQVAMWQPWHAWDVVRVLMMLVMDVFVVVLGHSVLMLMLVSFREVQPYAQRHQRRGDEK